LSFMKMKRIHLFEFEDLSWFPNPMRASLTRLLSVMHNILNTQKDVAQLILRLIDHSAKPSIIDLCSGSGGPMPGVATLLKNHYSIKNLTLTLTDLYPDKNLAGKLNSNDIIYLPAPVDAANVPVTLQGIRTMICSFHHMKPDTARNILRNTKDSKQPMCIFEISNNSFPAFLWWIAIPFNFITAFFITPLAKGLTWQQMLFTYLLPVIPLTFAWDGAVSNARTYTLPDLDILLEGLSSDDYRWEKGTISGKSTKLYLLGFPIQTHEKVMS
jgi:hypothetical protein